MQHDSSFFTFIISGEHLFQLINIEIQFEEQNQISISFYNKEGKRMKLKNDANKSLESEDHSTLKTIHGNQRPHKCDSCDKYFGNKESLVIHIKRVHENVKPYHCEFCDKSFGKKRHLDLHSKIVHGNSKTFYCDYCDKSFGHKNVLNTQFMKTQHLTNVNLVPKLLHKATV